MRDTPSYLERLLSNNISGQGARTSMMPCMQDGYPMAILRPVFVSVHVENGVVRALKSIRTDIADVSHFVLPETPIDSEAASRGTTVYLVDKRIDMLPSLLGTNLCSLRPFVERLAFSAIWVCWFILAPGTPQLTRACIHTGIDT